MPFLLTKGYTGAVYFQIAGETCIGCSLCVVGRHWRVPALGDMTHLACFKGQAACKDGVKETS